MVRTIWRLITFQATIDTALPREIQCDVRTEPCSLAQIRTPGRVGLACGQVYTLDRHVRILRLGSTRWSRCRSIGRRASTSEIRAPKIASEAAIFRALALEDPRYLRGRRPVWARLIDHMQRLTAFANSHRTFAGPWRGVPRSVVGVETDGVGIVPDRSILNGHVRYVTGFPAARARCTRGHRSPCCVRQRFDQQILM